MKIRHALALLLLLMQFSCVEKYWPELGGKYDQALVVDGMITDKPGPYTVKLSLSSGVEFPKPKPYTGCAVSIIAGDGTSELLTENEPGVYTSSSQGIRGEIGQKYRISIRTPDGQTYESEFQELKAPVEVASVYHEVEYRPSDELNHQLQGLQFYLDTKPAVRDTSYLLWKLESTYKFQSDFLIRYVYDHRRLTVFPQPDSFYTCWRYDQLPDVYTFETSGLTEPQLTRIPLHFVSTEGRELSIRYSLLVKQLSITKKAYTFWNNIREQNENQGALYSKQPYQIRGNVINTGNPDDAAMGYFLVAGIAEQRIFVDRPGLTFYYYRCVLTRREYEAVGDLRWSSSSEWPIYLTTDNDGRMAVPDPRCIDCRERGGKIEEPEYWED